MFDWYVIYISEKNKIAKQTWNDEESAAIQKHFQKQLAGTTSTVRADEIRECMKPYRCLASRTPAQIRVKINDLIKEKKNCKNEHAYWKYTNCIIASKW